MSEQSPRLTPTHSADEFQGAFLGIEASFLPWVGLALLASLGLFFFLFYGQEWDFPAALEWSSPPVVLTVVFLRTMQQGKPPGYVSDLLTSILTRGHAKPPDPTRPRHRLISNCIPDGYLADGAIVFEGPGGGHIAFGLWAEVPSFQVASFAEDNLFQDVKAILLQLLPPGWTMQVRESDHSGDAVRLFEYQQQTEECANPSVRTLRNANFINLWQRLERRELQRKRVALFIGRPLDPSNATSWWRRPTESQYAGLLAEARTTFTEWSHTVSQALQSIGGRVVTMTDADSVRLWADAFNPSFTERPTYDPAQHFDPAASLAENCWFSELRGQGRQGFILDGWHVLALTLSRLPAETSPPIIHRLAYIPFDGITICVQIRRLDKAKVLQQAQANLARIHQQLLRKPDELLNVTRSQLQDKVRRLAGGEAAPFEMEFIVIVRAKTTEELLEKAGAVKSAIQAMGGQYYEATLPATSRNLFAKTLPGWMGSRHHGFRHYIEDRSLADLLPLCSTFTGHPGPVQALFPGSDRNLVNIVTFLGEGNDATAQNLIIFGTPGAGKSRMLLKHEFETIHSFGFEAILEEGGSQMDLTKSFGLDPIVFRLDGLQTLNPFDTKRTPSSSFVRATLTALVARMVGQPADEDKARRQSARIAWHVARLCQDKAQDMMRNWSEDQQLEVIRHALALDRWAKSHSIPYTEAFVDFREFRQAKPAEAEEFLAQFTEADLREFESTEGAKINDLIFAYLRPEEHLRLSSLREHFEMEGQDEEESRWLATLLSPWCVGGNCGALFDGVSTVDLTAPIVHFELGLIPEAAKEIRTVVGFLIINGIRHHILSLPRLMWKRIIVEEVSRFLDVPGGEAILRELFEQFRKHKTQITLTVQAYSRIADTPIRVPLMGNARAFAIFNTGDRQDIERLGKDIGLSRLAQETIQRFPRPDQQVGEKYSEFMYYHTDVRQPICGPVRYVLLPHEAASSPNPTQNHQQ